MHAEDSNSASVKTNFSLVSAQCSRGGLYTLTTSTGHSLQVRAVYLIHTDETLLAAGSVLSEEESIDIIQAGMCVLVERKALAYIARSEQCSYGLQLKLQKKGYRIESITPVLLFLEQNNYINDDRFAQAWLQNRIIHQKEGSISLINGLVSRGIRRNVAAQAVNDFLKIYSEKELCKSALVKYRKCGKSDEQIIRCLLRKGFSYSEIIKNVKSETLF